MQRKIRGITINSVGGVVCTSARCQVKAIFGKELPLNLRRYDPLLYMPLLLFLDVVLFVTEKLSTNET